MFCIKMRPRSLIFAQNSAANGNTYKQMRVECIIVLSAYSTGTLSWELCPTQGRQPRALGHTTAVVGDTLYVFGGIYHGTATNALYMLNTGTCANKNNHCMI